MQKCKGCPPQTAGLGLYHDAGNSCDTFYFSQGNGTVRFVGSMTCSRATHGVADFDELAIPTRGAPRYNVEYVRSQMNDGETLDKAGNRLLEEFEELMGLTRLGGASNEQIARHEELSQNLLSGG